MADQGSLSTQKKWTVAADQAGIRLDTFVGDILPYLSRRQVEKAIDGELFLVNGRPRRKGQRLGAGASVTFVGPVQWLSDRPLANLQVRVPIVYEDSHLLVVDKPAGMDTHGFSGRDSQTLANFLAARRPELLAVGKSKWEPGLVHRLDRETSGLVLIAKSQASFEQLRIQLRGRQIKKTYWGLVWGATAARGSVSYPLAHDAQDRRRMRAVVSSRTRTRPQKSWQALTRFRKINSTQRLSLLEIEMETGVTHQIRVHLATIGHPIVGDRLYGSQDLETFGLPRHFLHAHRLELQHPLSGRTVKFETGWPGELQEVLKRLRLEY
ncbi:MAG TPA: RluA family pseudouridine synthase [Candidatus Udaeobacter sp.]|nr:RluA family pseudouridine synthase [Candidatus Udaeobacter sp.]